MDDDPMMIIGDSSVLRASLFREAEAKLQDHAKTKIEAQLN